MERNADLSECLRKKSRNYMLQQPQEAKLSDSPGFSALFFFFFFWQAALQWQSLKSISLGCKTTKKSFIKH